MTADIQAAKERLTQLRDELTRRSGYVNHIPSARERDAGNAGAINALLAELSRLEGENEQLRLTILGGEDAPGYAASLPIEAVEEAHRANMASWHAEADTVLAMEAALTSDEEPDDYVPTPRQRAEDYSRWARATYKSYREWLERATNAEAALAEARRQIAELTKPGPCCEHMAERLRQKVEEGEALAILRDRGHKLSPSQAEKADRARTLSPVEQPEPDRVSIAEIAKSEACMGDDGVICEGPCACKEKAALVSKATSSGGEA